MTKFSVRKIKEDKRVKIKKIRMVPINRLLWWGLIFIFLIIGLLITWQCQRNYSSLPESQSDKKKIDLISPLDGLILKEQTKLPIAVILDNFEESRPVSGINSASIVYEAPAEADITRFLAIFSQESLPNKIGPVRSVRPYLVEWAEEYSALFIHAGGSPEAIKNIRQNAYQIYNLDEISGDGIYFWRDWQRKAPHNLYVSKTSIENVVENKSLPEEINPDFDEWKFKPEAGPPEILGENQLIKIDFRESVVWQFDKDSNSYWRFQEGEPFVDENGEQIKTKNLIIQKTEITVLDKIGRRFIKTTGQGQALIFQNGQVVEGQWRRAENSLRTKFYDDRGEEIEFLPGLTWIEVVSPRHKLFY